MNNLERINLTIDIRMLLEKLGADARSIKQMYNKPDYRCPCWFRGGDNAHGLGATFDTKKKRWKFTDFTNRTFGNADLFDFIQHVTGMDFVNSIKLAESCCSGSEKDIDIDDLVSNSNAIDISDESILNCFTFASHPYLQERGYSLQAIKNFNLGFSNSFVLQDRIIIPVRDENNKLVAVQGRSFEGEEPKYIYYEGTGNNAKRTLYNYNNAIEYAKKKGYIFLVEGCPSVWRMFDYGCKNVVASMSTSVTDEQIKLLTKEGLHIIVFFDWDINMSGQYATIKLIKKLAELHYTNVSYIKARKEGSPDDFTKEEILNMYLNNRVFPFKKKG